MAARAHEEVSRPPSSSGSRRAAHGVQQRRVGSGCRASRRRKRFRDCLWNAALIAGFYTIYALIRNVKGSAITEELEARALHHGLLILDVERTLGLDHEATIQSFFLRLPALMKAGNIFNATTHFIVTSAVLAALTVAGARRYDSGSPPARRSAETPTVEGVAVLLSAPVVPARALSPALLELLEEPGTTEEGGVERVLRHDGRQAGLDSEASGEPVEERSTAREDDALLHDVAGELGRGLVDGRLDRADGRSHLS